MNTNKLKIFLIKIRWYFVGLCIVLIFAAIIKQYFYYKEINENKKETIGVVEKFEYSSRGLYTLFYKYEVNNKPYKHTIGTSGFYGYNKRKGCVGCTFKVYYSSKDPSKSSIRLGKYEEYKRTIEFGQFD